jgi:site-specific recombinase XerD
MNKTSIFLNLLDDFINNYLPYSVGVSPNTVISYKYAFRLLIEFLYSKKGISADKVSFNNLDYTTLLDFFEWIEKDRGCSIPTKNQRLSAILSFSAYAQNRDLSAASTFRTSVLKIPMKKGQMKPRAVFTTQEVCILLRLPDDHSKIGRRNKVLLSLMYASGARAQEMCNLCVGDIEFHSNDTRVKLNGKGEKTRRIFIPETCGIMLHKYIGYKRIENKPERHVFSSQTHEMMTISCIEGIFNKYVTLAKEKNPDLFKEHSYPPHSMRHATSTHMLESGVPIVVIKNFLGHKSIQSTQIYAELTQNTVKKYLKEWNEKWFSHNAGSLETTISSEKEIPDFLKIK